jgi:hypothetical protein
MRSVILLLGLLLSLTTLGCETPEKMTRISANASVQSSKIPAIDANAAKQIETATFGLG